MLDVRHPLDKVDITVGETVPMEIDMKVDMPVVMDGSTLCKADDSEERKAREETRYQLWYHKRWY